MFLAMSEFRSWRLGRSGDGSHDQGLGYHEEAGTPMYPEAHVNTSMWASTTKTALLACYGGTLLPKLTNMPQVLGPTW